MNTRQKRFRGCKRRASACNVIIIFYFIRGATIWCTRGVDALMNATREGRACQSTRQSGWPIIRKNIRTYEIKNNIFSGRCVSHSSRWLFSQRDFASIPYIVSLRNSLFLVRGTKKKRDTNRSVTFHRGPPPAIGADSIRREERKKRRIS